VQPELSKVPEEELTDGNASFSRRGAQDIGVAECRKE